MFGFSEAHADIRVNLDHVVFSLRLAEEHAILKGIKGEITAVPPLRLHQGVGLAVGPRRFGSRYRGRFSFSKHSHRLSARPLRMIGWKPIGSSRIGSQRQTVQTPFISVDFFH